MRQWMIDAFAPAPFLGNPACVVEPLDAWPAEAWMQSLAAENNQAETAFLLRTVDANCFGLRWFTPILEVPLCGHATLASAHVVLQELEAGGDRVLFDTLSGRLDVCRTAQGYEMDFPASSPRRIDTPDGLGRALGAEPAEVHAAQYLVAVMKDEHAVRSLAPDMAALMAISSAATLGRGNVGVAAVADHGLGYDVVSRFFAPGSGVNEDPATGSLHCILAPLFAARIGRNRVRFHQAYPGRGGELECEHVGQRVLLRGQAQTILESALRVEPR